jgi:hypothetical protein
MSSTLNVGYKGRLDGDKVISWANLPRKMGTHNVVGVAVRMLGQNSSCNNYASNEADSRAICHALGHER